MAERLDGTAALITGASSGIGAATALELAGLGASVALAARRVERLEELAEKIRSQGGRAEVIKADVSNELQAREAVERAAGQFGRLDTLVNNAGVMLLGPAEDAPLAEWQQMVQINLLGTLYCTHVALPLLLNAARNDPRQVADLVNVSSVAGRVARAGNSVYSATKHAVGAFSESLRQEVTRRHVRVSIVEPGAVETELASHNRPEILDGLQQRFASQRRMAASDISETIAFIVTRPRHVAINEILVRPTDQEQ